MKRATLAEMQGLDVKSRMLPAAVELTRWRERGLIDFDVERGAFFLTDEGHHRVRQCCATCGSWRRLDRDCPDGPIGECQHAERNDDWPACSKAPVEWYWSVCEVFWPRPDDGEAAA